MKDVFRSISEISSRLSPEKRKLLVDLIRPDQEPIAIVGIGCRFPGGAHDVESFWALLRDGFDAIVEVPADRWDADALCLTYSATEGRTCSRWGGFLGGVDRFDARFFGIAPREAITMDPQQRLLLEVAWEALENAGIAPERLTGSRTGIFVGVSTNDYAHLVRSAGLSDLDLYAATGTNASVASGRLSYFFGFQGPSISVDTACSSSLVAVHLAIRSLRTGESDLVLAGGVNLLLSPEYSICFSNGQMLSGDGRCKTFDAAADGYVRGEGCGVIVLKRLSEALEDRDRVMAVLRGSAINQDGKSSGLTVPNGLAQEQLIRDALADARLNPADVGYVEAHGTGTSLGDPIEVNSLAEVLGRGRSREEALMLGSVKTNIGHLEAAAGIAGLIKTVLALEHGEIPPHLNLRHPTPYVPWDQIPVIVPTRITPWLTLGRQRIAGVSSFGFSGSNAHILLEEAPPLHDEMREPDRPAHILALSALDPGALGNLAERFAAHLEKHPEQSLGDVCFTANSGRSHFPCRLAVLGRSHDQVRAGLAAFVSGREAPGLSGGRGYGGDAPRLAFLFTGQGSEYAGMGAGLYQTQPVFREAMDRCDALLKPYLEEPLLPIIYEQRNDPSRLHETALAQPALFSIEYACCALWRSWGVVPGAVLGHSLGEYVAACVAGVLSLEDGLRIVAERGRLMQSLEPGGMMLTVLAPGERVREAVAPYAETVSIAAENGPENIVISGPIGVVQKIRAELERESLRTLDLKASRAFHSSLVEPVLGALERAVSARKLSLPTIRMISNLTGRAATPSEVTLPAYWRRHARETVRFAEGVETLRSEGYEIFVEVGPGSGLLALGQQCVGQGYGVWLPTIRKARNDGEEILESLAALYASGVKIDWIGFDQNRKRRKLSLPTYPFERQSYWLGRRNATDPMPGLRQGPGGYHPLLGRKFHSPLPEIQFESHLSSTSPGFLCHHSVHGVPVLPASAYFEMMLRAAGSELGPGNYDLVNLTFGEALLLPAGEMRNVRTILIPAEDGSASARVLSLSAGREGESPSWTLHASGRLCPDLSGEILQRSGNEEVDSAGLGEISIAAFYKGLRERGIDYGESFQGIVELRQGNGSAVAKLRLPASLESDLPAYGCHPALLDACLQVAAAVQPYQSEAFMPFSVERLRCRVNIPGSLGCRATLRSDYSANRELFSVDLELTEESGAVIGVIEGLRLKRAPRSALHPSPAGRGGWLYEVYWHPQDLPAAASAEQGMASHEELAAHILKQWPNLGASHGLDVQREANPDLDDLCSCYIVNALHELGWKPCAGAATSVASLARLLKIAARHRRLLGRILEMLSDDGFVSRTADGWKVLREPQPRDAVKTWAAVMEKFPSCGAELRMLRRSGERLAEALRGEVDALDLLFPEGSHADAERLYEESPFSRVYNAAVAEALKVALEKVPAGRRAKILEIGAGTGGTASWILRQLAPQKADYVFTDVSPLFLSKASERFRHQRHISCRMLDIERDPGTQGFEGERFDCLLAVDVLHATRNLRESLKHAAQLLEPGGLLLLVEGTSRLRWVDLVFGLTEGWWRFQDLDLRSGHPLLSASRWLKLLGETGFEDAKAVPEAEDSGWQTLIVARSPGSEHIRAVEEDQGRWLIFADLKIGSLLAEQLDSLGGPSMLVFPRSSAESQPDEALSVDPMAADEFEKLYPDILRAGPCRGVLYMWGMESDSSPEQSPQDLEASQRLACAGALHVVQTMVKAPGGVPPPLWLVTRGAQAVAGEGTSMSVAQATLWGLARVVAQEHPDLSCRVVDLDPLDDQESVRLLLLEILSGDGESQISYRGGRRHVARLRKVIRDRESEEGAKAEPDAPFRLSTESPGILSNLRLRPCARIAPGRGQVEIQVLAAGLNFRDLMIALGAYHADSRNFGMECAGRIVRVGEGVDGFAQGDEVVGIAPGSFASFAVTSAEMVAKKPPEFGFEEAATIPVAFLTAEYSLRRLARLSAGERVLIHAAAGGVGLAAVQLAQRAGAQIFATAGNERKRAYLKSLGVQHVMDSRKLAFAEEVLERTAGQGVDVVLNSLAGEFIPKSLSVLSRGGRFVEIGRTDIWSPDRVAELREDVEYHTVALDLMTEAQPREMGELLRSVLDEFRANALHPLPLRVFQCPDIIGAFRHMERSRHIGKIVVAFESKPTPKDAASLALRPDSTYLITGGFGGLGILVAKWMVDKGARHLVLASRGSASGKAEAAAREWEAQGAEVVLQRTDITCREDLARLFSEIDATMPPLAGLVHAAGVLDDGLLMKQEWKRFEAVMKPKVTGAWNLHLAARERDLDFFVMFSSAASLLGTPGQGNHAAANAFLDALAHLRRREGLPAVSIDWGAWSEVGSAVGRGVEEALRQGLGVIRPDDGLRALELAMQWNRPQLAVLPVHWDRYLRNRKGQRREPFFQFVSRTDQTMRAPEKIKNERQRIVSRLMQAAPAERFGMLRSQVQAHAISVLGIDASQALDWRQPLQELGLDSLMALELRNALGTMMERQLPATLLFDHPTIAGLTEYLARELLPSQQPPNAGAKSRRASVGAVDLLDRVESLSEDEVERLLKEKH